MVDGGVAARGSEDVLERIGRLTEDLWVLAAVAAMSQTDGTMTTGLEEILVASGLGRLLLEFSGRMQSDMVFATVLAVIIEALALLAAMQAVERKLTGWAPNVSIG